MKGQPSVGGGQPFEGHPFVGGHVFVKLHPTVLAQAVSTKIKQEFVAPPITCCDSKLEMLCLFNLSPLCFRFFFFMII
jgi:hypothetical protein